MKHLHPPLTDSQKGFIQWLRLKIDAYRAIHPTEPECRTTFSNQ